MKVAQYEVLGLTFKRVTRPGRDDRLLPALAKPCAEKMTEHFDRPFGTGTS